MMIDRLKSLLPLVLLLSALAFGYWLGFQQKARIAAAQISELKLQYAQTEKESNDAYLAALTDAQNERQKWHDFAQRQSEQLARAAQTFDAQKDILKKEINHAIEQDKSSGGNGNCALGANGLRLYRQALGYAD